MNKSNFKQPDQQYQEKIISTLKEVILAVTGSFDLDTLLQRIVESCVKFSNSSRGSLFLYDEESEELVMRAEKNNKPELRFNARYKTNVSNEEIIGLTTFVFKTGETLALNSPEDIINHPQHLGKFNKDSNGEIDCQSLICIPLKNSDKQPIGVIKIENTLERKDPQIFSDEDIQHFQLLADIVSEAIINFKNQAIKIDTSINTILSKALQSSKPGNLSKRLRQISATFKEISNAVGVSIWLQEGSTLVCKAAVGHNYKALEERLYDLSIDPSKVKNIGLTPWIAKSGETLNIKNHQELISHPQYKGTYDEVLYPDKQEQCESFIGAPLKTGDKIIGVIKADSRIPDEQHPEKYFTTEEAQIFSYLSIITSIIVESEQEFERANSHNLQLLTLYKLGTECYELESSQAIFWYLLTGLTHGNGIGFNRAVLFNFADEKKQLCLIGLIGLGPLDKAEGKVIQKLFNRDNRPDIEKCKSEFNKETDSPPLSKLQEFIKDKKIIISKNCDLYHFINDAWETKKSHAQFISINQCCEEVKSLFLKLETRGDIFLVFSILDADGQMFIGICDNVYSEHCPNDEYSLKAANTFISQVSLALSRLSLKKTKEETTEEAWQEFTAMTAHRIGTETSIMSGALDFFKKSLPIRDDYSSSWKSDLIVLENSLDSLKKAVREYTELQKPPEIYSQKIQLGEILDQVKIDLERLQSNQTEPVLIYKSYGKNLPIIDGDYDSLLYAFKEIFENAIRAMPNGGKLETHAAIVNHGEYLQITISDTGTGIKPESLPKIFNRGFKDRSGGTGLGLYIVKRNIELHRGTVEAKNNQTKGASFIVTLPLPKSSINRIMIVEDNDMQREYLCRSIHGKYSKLTIDIANNENQAIDLLDSSIHESEQDKYDFIIADINLEDGGGSKFGGLNVLEYVKEKTIDVKVIIITAHTGMKYQDSSGKPKSVLDRARELGAFRCLSRNQVRNYLDELNEILEN